MPINRTTVFVSGPTVIDKEQFDDHFARPICSLITKGFRKFVVSDDDGTAAMVQKLLYIHTTMNGGEPDIEVTVYHNGDTPRNNEWGFPTNGGFASSENRDYSMSNASQKDLAWAGETAAYGEDTRDPAVLRNIERRKEIPVRCVCGHRAPLKEWEELRLTEIDHIRSNSSHWIHHKFLCCPSCDTVKRLY